MRTLATLTVTSETIHPGEQRRDDPGSRIPGLIEDPRGFVVVGEDPHAAEASQDLLEHPVTKDNAVSSSCLGCLVQEVVPTNGLFVETDYAGVEEFWAAQSDPLLKGGVRSSL